MCLPMTLGTNFTKLRRNNGKQRNPNQVKRYEWRYNVSRRFISDIDVVVGSKRIEGKSLNGLLLTIGYCAAPIKASINSDNVAELRKFDAEMENFRWIH